MDVKQIKQHILTLVVICFTALIAVGQPVPGKTENIDFICTFGNESETQWGDDDFVQVFFFLVPKQHKKAIYLRVFDPNTGGKHDLLTDGAYDTHTAYSIFGGPGSYSNEDSRNHKPSGNYKLGNLLISLTFGPETKYDDTWFTFGPFNPSEGEYVKNFDAYLFKVIAEGTKGNDGNMYRYFLSESDKANIPIEGGNAFTYNYSFRLKPGKLEVAHLYPFIDNNIVSITQYNFDFDNEGLIEIFSVSKNGEACTLSGDDEQAKSKHSITANEKGKSLNIQIVKNMDRINDMSFYILNQYDKPVPFFATPIGGIPQYKFNIGVEYDYENRKRSFK